MVDTFKWKDLQGMAGGGKRAVGGSVAAEDWGGCRNLMRMIATPEGRLSAGTSCAVNADAILPQIDAERSLAARVETGLRMQRRIVR